MAEALAALEKFLQLVPGDSRSHNVKEMIKIIKKEAAERLVKLREAGYLVVRGRGRSASYDLNRALSDKLRGRDRVDAEMLLDRESVKLRILSFLPERGRLTNSEIRRFTGMDRIHVYRLVKELETEGKIRFQGRGRAAFIELTENN